MKMKLVKIFILCIFILVYIAFLYIIEYRMKKLKKVINLHNEKKYCFFFIMFFFNWYI